MSVSPTFDLTSPAFHADPFPTLRRLREAGPLVHVELPVVGPTWLATTHDASSRIMKDPENLVREPRKAGLAGHAGIKWWMPRSVTILADNMLGKDDPEHRRLRSLVDLAFQRRSINEMHDEIAAVADRLLDDLARDGGGDLVQHYARDLPLTVICQMLGLPHDDRDRFKRWMGGLSKTSSAIGFLRALPGIYRVVHYLKREIARQRAKPGSGLITALIEAEEGGSRLSDDELLAMVFLLFGAGHETTTHLISGGIWTLLIHPDEKGRLLADATHYPGTVEECLRHYAPVQMTKPRYARADMVVEGQTVRRGENVIPFLASANADPAKFRDPERFDIARKPNPHLSFATGPHFCLGFQLARAEARIAMDRLFQRFPATSLAVASGEIGWQRRLGLRSLIALPVRLAA
jgi:cytochrome P450